MMFLNLITGFCKLIFQKIKSIFGFFSNGMLKEDLQFLKKIFSKSILISSIIVIILVAGTSGHLLIKITKTVHDNFLKIGHETEKTSQTIREKYNSLINFILNKQTGIRPKIAYENSFTKNDYEISQKEYSLSQKETLIEVSGDKEELVIRFWYE
jgi:hypothetical protein